MCHKPLKFPLECITSLGTLRESTGYTIQRQNTLKARMLCAGDGFRVCAHPVSAALFSAMRAHFDPGCSASGNVSSTRELRILDTTRTAEGLMNTIRYLLI